MRKAIPILLFSVAIVSFAFSGCKPDTSDESTTDANDYFIETIDKSVPVTPGNLITKTATDDDGNISVDYYNSTGNLVESYLWNENNEIISHSIMKYTADNNLQIKEDISPDGSNSSVESYQYDQNGNLSSKTLHQYENGKLKKSSSYDSSGTITGYSVSHYNSDDTLNKIERFDEEDSLIEYYTYKYDDNGKAVRYSSFDKNDNLTRYTTFSYNEQGLVEFEKQYSADDILSNYYQYTYYSDGSIKSSSNYDANGNLISENYFEETTQDS